MHCATWAMMMLWQHVSVLKAGISKVAREPGQEQ
jgi:hypothetical protein